MAREFSISSNVRDVARYFSQAQREGIPFAAIVAMTRTAQAVKQVQVSELRRVFDRPTPYTLNALFVSPATKRRPVALVGFKDFSGKGTPAWKYLGPQVEGGPRRSKRSEVALRLAGLLPPGLYVVPGAGAEIDAYGNMSRGQIVKILSYLRAFGEQGYVANRSRTRKSRGVRRNEQYFVGAPGGAPLGVWQRKGGAIVPVMIFVRAPQYQKRYPFHEVSDRVVRFQFPAQFERAMAEWGNRTPKPRPVAA